MPNAGKFDQPIIIETPVVTRSAIGEETRSWAVFARPHADITTVRGAEFVAAMQAQYRMDIKVRVRWRAGINNMMRIVWRGQPYAIVAVMDGGPRKRYVEMMCSSGVEDGR